LPNEVRGKLDGILNSWRFRTFCKPIKEGFVLAADKGRWWLLSPQVIHIGLIFIICGLLVSATSGFKLRRVLLELNKWQLIPEVGLNMRFVDNGIEIKQNNQSAIYDLPQINQPIFYNGLSIYNAGESQQIRNVEIRIESNTKSQLINFKIGQEYEIEPGLKLVFGKIIPDFRIGQGLNVESASSEYNNPAIHVSLMDHGRLIESKWLFVNLPNFSRLLYKGFDIGISSANWMPCFYVDITRNQGVWLALAGGIIIVLGLAWNLLGGFNQINIEITQADKGGSLLAFSGSAAKTITQLQKKLLC
jgi:hypothetical protein